MNKVTEERITKHFAGLTFSLLGAIWYLDDEIKLGNISHYSVHTTLLPFQPIADGRYLELQVDDVPIRVDFGLDGVLFSMVEEDKRLGEQRSKAAFILTLGKIIEARLLPISINTKFDFDKLYEHYEEEYNND